MISIPVTYAFNADGTVYSEDSALKVKTEFTYALEDDTLTHIQGQQRDRL